jgi:DNA (cytosine-5)-methyltransferase 1
VSKPRLLDLFCCAGGAGMGYAQAGFDVVGVDINPQPRYPFEFVQADALGLSHEFLGLFDAIHASPPCQAYSNAQRLRQNEHPDLIAQVRGMLLRTGAPYVIENVPGSPLAPTATVLCGSMFPELRVYRHRWFETNWSCEQPPLTCWGHHPNQVKMGRPVKDGDFIQVVGNFSGVEYARKAMGIDWMTRNELREAIPPAYTKHLGEQLVLHIAAERLAA